MKQSSIGRRFNLTLAILAVIALASYGMYKNHQKKLWLNEFHLVEATIISLIDKPPSNCSRQHWNNAVNRVWAGFSNACHNPSTTSAESIRLLGQDIQELIRGSDVTIELLRRIWTRIGNTSVVAKALIDRHQVDFEDHLRPCERKSSDKEDKKEM